MKNRFVKRTISIITIIVILSTEGIASVVSLAAGNESFNLNSVKNTAAFNEDKVDSDSSKCTLTDETTTTNSTVDINTSDGMLSTASNSSGQFVIAIDPGHDSNKHGGTSGYGFKEQDVVLKIANYLKSILEQYKGVKVVLTRTSNNCPYPNNAASANDIAQRVNATAKQGADVYISLHMNYSSAASARGAEVIIPNANGNASVYNHAKALGNNILNSLGSIGLSKRKVYTCTESDGSDSFAVQRCSKRKGIPGIIIEHAFMSNAYDSQFFTSESGLKKLAQADANGIINTYGLTKDIPNKEVYYRSHVQNIGWQSYAGDGAVIGTSGRSLRMEALKIGINTNKLGYSGSIKYSAHVQNIGWQSNRSNDSLAGTVGESKRLEAIKIWLEGDVKNYYDVYYRVHAQNIGWMGWTCNGNPSGTSGYSYRLEAMQIVLVKKGETLQQTLANKNLSSSYSTSTKAYKQKGDPDLDGLSYSTHVQNYGWQNCVNKGAVSGTTGKSLRLEAIRIKLNNLGYSGSIKYNTHIQNIGWQNDVNNSNTWKADGAVSGTSGQSKRLEAIQIQLTGDIANHYDVYYRVHCQNIGWMGWAKNGEKAGSAGYSYRLEGIQIVLVEKDASAPGSTSNCFKQK